MSEVEYGDNEPLNIGTDSDVALTWVSASSLLTMIPLADGVGFYVGNGTLDMDFRVYCGAADLRALEPFVAVKE